MYRICKTIELESGHLLSKHTGNCQFPHGHTRSVEVVLVADSLDENDMVADFKVVHEILDGVLGKFDHALCMNTEDPNYATFCKAYGERIIPFPHSDPTSEAMAAMVFRCVKEALAHAAEDTGERRSVRRCVRLERTRVWETSSTWAEYFE